MKVDIEDGPAVPVDIRLLGDPSKNAKKYLVSLAILRPPVQGKMCAEDLYGGI